MDLLNLCLGWLLSYLYDSPALSKRSATDSSGTKKRFSSILMISPSGSCPSACSFPPSLSPSPTNLPPPHSPNKQPTHDDDNAALFAAPWHQSTQGERSVPPIRRRFIAKRTSSRP